MIKDIKIKKLGKFEDERGWLTEIYRKDSDNFQAVMSYISYTKFNVEKWWNADC